MSQKKKAVREAFRADVFKRDKHKCRMCGITPDNGDDGLDAHHITDRTLMASGGYVKENGISLCASCHLKAEEFHKTGVALPGFAPEDLYAKIGSSLTKAIAASLKL
jgi:5-methylcytosine-specific restriction endonuclease McrA